MAATAMSKREPPVSTGARARSLLSMLTGKNSEEEKNHGPMMRHVDKRKKRKGKGGKK